MSDVRKAAEQTVSDLKAWVKRQTSAENPHEKLSDVVREMAYMTNILLTDERERMQKNGAGFR